jgi:hypothetical protein
MVGSVYVGDRDRFRPWPCLGDSRAVLTGRQSGRSRMSITLCRAASNTYDASLACGLPLFVWGGDA